MREMCYKRKSEGGLALTGARDAEPTKQLREPRNALQSTGAEAEFASQFCPGCSARLEARSCKMICPACGYYMSCSDFY
jgi:hypothetical protein